VSVQQLDDTKEQYPTDLGWLPHKPETWPYKFATLKRAVTMRHRRDNKDVDIEVPAGQTVKLVMVSRLGDVGLTEDLTAENGYGIRLQLNDLCNWRTSPLERQGGGE
jgi:hypothetical protein